MLPYLLFKYKKADTSVSTFWGTDHLGGALLVYAGKELGDARLAFFTDGEWTVWSGIGTFEQVSMYLSFEGQFRVRRLPFCDILK